MARDVVIVPHTHWDREWYSPVPDLPPAAGRPARRPAPPAWRPTPSYAHFLLDGQMAVVDDYLAVRPEAEPALRRLAASGRLAMGPWYILMDEFLVSGETIVRDLQLGLERAAAFGGAMAVGYLPDMFGHIAQMPQMLGAVRLRPRGGLAGRPGRRCTARRSGGTPPTARTVRAQYLPEGYGNGAVAARRRQGPGGHDPPASTTDLRASWPAGRTAAVDERHRPPDAPSRGWAGWWPRPTTSRTTTGSGSRSLAEYLAEASSADGSDRGPGAWVWCRASCARAPGPTCSWACASNRTDVRQAAAVAERWIERLAEPLSALWLPPERWPASLLDRGLARADPQLGPRLDLRLLGRRGGRRRAAPLRRGPPDRRGPHVEGPGRAGAHRGGWRAAGGERDGPPPLGARRAHRGRRGDRARHPAAAPVLVAPGDRRADPPRRAAHRGGRARRVRRHRRR